MDKRPNIIVLDPSYSSSAWLTEGLSGIRAQCLLAMNPEGALSLASNHAFEVIVAPLRPYEAGGAQDFDFCRAARSQHPTKPLLVMPKEGAVVDGRFKSFMLENRNIVLLKGGDISELEQYLLNIVGLEPSVDSDDFSVEVLPELDSFIQSNLISPNYQPIVSLSDGSIYGYEALARSEMGGLLNHPGVLFEYAANKSMFSQIDYACTKASLRDAAGKVDGKRLFLNVQPRSLADVDFPEVIHAYAVDHGHDPRKIFIELTEQEGVKNFRLFHASLKKLREFGFKIAVDDFGEGNANFEMLLHVAPDIVKISGKIINHIEAFPPVRDMMKSFAELCGKLGVITIAEFIETASQRDLLEDLGVDLGQGWHLGRPLKPDQI